VSGSKEVGIVSRDHSFEWTMDYEPGINHETPISRVMPLSEERLLTQAQEERVIKIWRFSC